MIQHTVQAHFFSAFQQFWHTGPGLHLLAALCRSACPDCAAVKRWTQGGCLVAARGIQRYITNSLKGTATDLRVSLVAVATDETESAHVLVKLCKDGVERYLDASGVWTREELLRRLAREYQYDAYALVPWENVALAGVRIPFDVAIAQSVEKTLAQALDSFTPACVFPLPDPLVA